MISALESTSLRPYLLRALYEWCTDHGFTPYIAVVVDETVQVPREYVKNGEIVLNISYDATSALKIGNDFIEFKARFAGTARDIIVPIGRVVAIYARENGQGMAFPPLDAQASEAGEVIAPGMAQATPEPRPGMHLVGEAAESQPGGSAAAIEPPPDEPPRPPSGGRPALKRVK